jgi:chlorophyllide a reductase subunit Z
VTQDFFASAPYSVVANHTYSFGLRQFLTEELGIPCAYAAERKPGEKPRNDETRAAMHGNPGLVVFGSFNERMYLAEAGRKAAYIPASFPGAIIRRATGTPFMGYAGATYIVQEYCNALFDALFHILPLGTELDKVAATPARPSDIWEPEAQALLDARVEREPFLIRISAAKRLREQVELAAREAGEARVTAARARAVLAAEAQPA